MRKRASQPSDFIVTLGGYDEKILWDTWRTFDGLDEVKVSNLYVSELEGLHMAENPFKWPSKDEISKAFAKVLLI